jgi:TonB family protein
MRPTLIVVPALIAMLIVTSGGADVAAASRSRVPTSAQSTAGQEQDREVFELAKDSKEIEPPLVLREVKPAYTRAAKEAGIQGVVWLKAVVRSNGTVGQVDVVKSLDEKYGLDAEAVKAAQQWLFEPGKKDGKPVDVRVTIEMSFTLKK